MFNFNKIEKNTNNLDKLKKVGLLTVGGLALAMASGAKTAEAPVGGDSDSSFSKKNVPVEEDFFRNKTLSKTEMIKNYFQDPGFVMRLGRQINGENFVYNSDYRKLFKQGSEDYIKNDDIYQAYCQILVNVQTARIEKLEKDTNAENSVREDEDGITSDGMYDPYRNIIYIPEDGNQISDQNKSKRDFIFSLSGNRYENDVMSPELNKYLNKIFEENYKKIKSREIKAPKGYFVDFSNVEGMKGRLTVLRRELAKDGIKQSTTYTEKDLDLLEKSTNPEVRSCLEELMKKSLLTKEQITYLMNNLASLYKEELQNKFQLDQRDASSLANKVENTNQVTSFNKAKKQYGEDEEKKAA